MSSARSQHRQGPSALCGPPDPPWEHGSCTKQVALPATAPDNDCVATDVANITHVSTAQDTVSRWERDTATPAVAGGVMPAQPGASSRDGSQLHIAGHANGLLRLASEHAVPALTRVT